jgi:hypothetical protein
VVTSNESDEPDGPEFDSDELGELGPFPDDIAIDVAERSVYRAFCLKRLTGLLNLRAQIQHEFDPEAALHHALVDRAIYTAYRDCVGAGAKGEARRLLAETVQRR